MIYKIPFSNIQSLQDVMNKIGEIGEFIYSNKVIFLHTDFDIPSIMKFLDQANSCSIEVIDGENYSSETQKFVSDWCFKKLLEDKTKEFENSKEGQEKIKYFMDYLDTLDKIRKEGVQKDGNKKPKEKSGKCNGSNTATEGSTEN